MALSGKKKNRIVFDSDKCYWCRSCELVCSLAHEGQCNPQLSRIRISVDTFNQEVKASICQQCGLCVRACAVEAISLNEKTGALIVDAARCIACGKCAEVCPFNIEGAIIKLNPLTGKYVKCDLCSGNPKCVKLCPTEALTYVQS